LGPAELESMPTRTLNDQKPTKRMVFQPQSSLTFCCPQTASANLASFHRVSFGDSSTNEFGHSMITRSMSPVDFITRESSGRPLQCQPRTGEYEPCATNVFVISGFARAPAPARSPVPTKVPSPILPSPNAVRETTRRAVERGAGLSEGDSAGRGTGIARFAGVAHDVVVRFDDPRYLGRRGRSFDAPRKLLAAASGRPQLEFVHHHAAADCARGGGLYPA
jgi:hypothetical protein